MKTNRDMDKWAEIFPSAFKLTLLKMGTELNKEFSTEEYQMTEKHLKKWSTGLVIREMQIKTTLRVHLTPIRMAKIKKLRRKQMLGRM